MFKDLYAFETTTIVSFIEIHQYKKRAQSNWNSTATRINIVNICDNDIDKVNALESDTCFLDFENDNNNI